MNFQELRTLPPFPWKPAGNGCAIMNPTNEGYILAANGRLFKLDDFRAEIIVALNDANAPRKPAHA